MGTEVIHVTPEIVCLRRVSYFTCSYIVRAKHGLVLIDAGMDSDALDVDIGLKAMGETRESIKAILLTHWHNDHAAGAATVHEWTGAPVYYHVGDEPYLTGKTQHNGLRGWLGDQIPEVGLLVLFKGLLGEATPRPVNATHFVKDGDVILDEFEVIATPGHTPGHLAFFYRPAKALFPGDALAVIDGRIRFMARPVTPDLEAARASLRRCLEFNPQIVCPGHREALTVNAPAACQDMLKYLDQNGPWPLLG